MRMSLWRHLLVSASPMSRSIPNCVPNGVTGVFKINCNAGTVYCFKQPFDKNMPVFIFNRDHFQVQNMIGYCDDVQIVEEEAIGVVNFTNENIVNKVNRMINDGVNFELMTVSVADFEVDESIHKLKYYVLMPTAINS